MLRKYRCIDSNNRGISGCGDMTHSSICADKTPGILNQRSELLQRKPACQVRYAIDICNGNFASGPDNDRNKIAPNKSINDTLPYAPRYCSSAAGLSGMQYNAPGPVEFNTFWKPVFGYEKLLGWPPGVAEGFNHIGVYGMKIAPLFICIIKSDN